MHINSAQKNSNKGNVSIVVVIILVLIIIGLVGFIITQRTPQNPIQQANQTEVPKTADVVPSKTKAIMDQSTWQTYPTEGSYTGWTIKHPVENAPIANEKDTRITLFNKENEAVMISIDTAGKLNSGTIDEHLKLFLESESCPLTADVVSTTLGTNKAHKFSNSCSEPNELGIFGKDVTTYILPNPHIENSYVVVKTYVDPKLATQQQLELSQSIVETLTILKPEQTMPEGYSGFKNPTLGYSVKFPEKYKIQTGESSWPNAELILYAGGQSYDLVIQVWDTEAAYKEYFDNNAAVLENVTVKKVKDKFVTLLNQNKNSEVQEIINSFSIEE